MLHKWNIARNHDNTNDTAWQLSIIIIYKPLPLFETSLARTGDKRRNDEELARPRNLIVNKVNSGLFFTEYFRYDGKMSIDTLPVYRLTKAVIVVAMATNWKLLSSGYHQMLSVIWNLLRQYFFANATKRMSIIPYFSVVPSPSSGRFKWNLIAEKFHASKLKGHKFKWASI